MSKMDREMPPRVGQFFLSVQGSEDAPSSRSVFGIAWLTQCFPLAIYAARYWVDLAQFEGVCLSLEVAMEHFDLAKPHFSTWVWIYDIDCRFREIMQSCSKRAQHHCGDRRSSHYITRQFVDSVTLWNTSSSPIRMTSTPWVEYMLPRCIQQLSKDMSILWSYSLNTLQMWRP